MFKLGIALLILVLVFDVAEATAAAGIRAESAVCTASVSREGDWWRDEAAIMGTAIVVEVRAADESLACRAIGDVMAEMRRIDETMSPYIETSRLSALNRDGATGFVEVGDELYGLIRRSLMFSELTDGAFDVTYASVGRYYDFRNGERPDDKMMAEAIGLINYRYLDLDPVAHRIRFLHEGVYVDLGGIAKGYAVDRSIRKLEDLGIHDAMVSAGGDSRIIGDRRGEPWVVGVRHPRNSQTNIAVLPLMDVSVSTSGDYERFFEEGGVRYHHIIDPVSGDSAREVTSVTILGADATTTDALSTSVFVLGLERGLALIDTMTGIDAIIVDGEGLIHFSDSLAEMAPVQGLALGAEVRP